MDGSTCRSSSGSSVIDAPEPDVKRDRLYNLHFKGVVGFGASFLAGRVLFSSIVVLSKSKDLVAPSKPRWSIHP